jgi:hypothetical protein
MAGCHLLLLATHAEPSQQDTAQSSSRRHCTHQECGNAVKYIGANSKYPLFRELRVSIRMLYFCWLLDLVVTMHACN